MTNIPDMPMNLDDLTDDELKLIKALRSDDKDVATDAVRGLIWTTLAPMFEDDDPSVNNPKHNNPHFRPPQHETWEEWKDEDFDAARVHGVISDPAKQWSFFLIGFMALQGMISEEEAEDTDHTLRYTLEEGLNAAAKDFDAHDYGDMRQMCAFAEYGQREKRLKKD